MARTRQSPELARANTKRSCFAIRSKNDRFFQRTVSEAREGADKFWSESDARRKRTSGIERVRPGQEFQFGKRLKFRFASVTKPESASYRAPLRHYQRNISGEAQMLDSTFVDVTGQALADNCPLVSNDPSAIEQVKAKILEYYAQVGTEPSADAVVRWATPFELELQEQAAAEAAEHERAEARLARIDRDMNRPSAEDRAEAEAEFRASRPQPVAREFKPTRDYSEKEIEQMDSETYRREILGVNSRVEDQNRTASSAPDKTLKSIRKKKIMKDRRSGDARMRAALRRSLLEEKGTR
jgi:hypothetical protein